MTSYEFEVLIVDDGSTDETTEVLHSMMLEHGDRLQADSASPELREVCRADGGLPAQPAAPGS